MQHCRSSLSRLMPVLVLLAPFWLHAQQQQPPQAEPGRLPPVNASSCTSVDLSGFPKDPSDPSCYAFGPGSTDNPTPVPPRQERPRVTALVRVDSVVARPAGPVPATETLQVVGSATMIKSVLPGIRACFSAGKGWNVISGAATSTACLDHRGEVIAYQECKPKVAEAPMVCTTVVTGMPPQTP